MKKDPNYRREAEKYANPIPSREFILDLLADLGEPASFKRLAGLLECESGERQDALAARLKAMVRDGQLVRDRRQIYALAGKVELISGRISAHADGFGFLIPDDKSADDIYLSFQQMRQAFHGDRALVRPRGEDRRGRMEGEIVEIIERNTRQLVGRLYPITDGGKKPNYVLEPLSRRMTLELLVDARDTMGATKDQIVVAEVIQQPGLHQKARARVIDILGDHLTPGIEVEIALRNNQIPFEFPEEVISEADAMPNKVTEEDRKDRRDLTKLPFVTIDGEDARDFDDAVYCEKNRQGWRLFVAIADVAHYVIPGSQLDQSAYERGTSVYFPQYVVPMLPEKLSNGLCSLRPEVERLSMVCEMTLSASGNITNYVFYQAVIRSHARLTYSFVNEIVGPGQEKKATKTKAQKHTLSSAVLENLDLLKSLYLVLDKRRRERGALDLDTVELGFEFNDEGRLEKIYPKTRLMAHRLIEELMLCANVSAARLIALHFPEAGLYRVHEQPEADSVEKLRDFLQTLGVNLDGGDLPDPADMQKAIDQLLKKKNGQIFQTAVLRAMKQARYQRENKGHYGLNYKEYTHFTSPIRRYPDLMVHRLIKTLIHGRKKCDGVASYGKSARPFKVRYSAEEIDTISTICSTNERRADACVYEVLDWIKCDYLSEHVGDSFEGVITGVTSFGLFVELKDLYVEGLVHVSTIKGDYYHLDTAYQSLIGERSGYCFALADVVVVQVAGVDPEEGKIDFELVIHEPGPDRRVKRKVKQKKTKMQSGRHRKKQADEKRKPARTRKRRT